MLPDWLSLVDIAFVAVALLVALGGYQKGFAGQVAHVITFVLLGLVLFYAYPRIYTQCGNTFRDMNETNMMWIILTGVAVLTVLFFFFLNKFLSKAFGAKISERADRAYGSIFGLIRGIFIALFAMIFLVILGPSTAHDVIGEKSWIGSVVCYDLVPRIQPRVNKSNIGGKVDKIRNVLLFQDDAGVLDP